MSVLLILLLSMSISASALLSLPRSNRYGVITSYDGPSTKDALIVETKRYDRNCFFSPVQCMLTYNDNLPLVVTRKASGRKRFDPLLIDYGSLQ
ncbi:unnamed protein product [Caenorhabditis sp. 36 PRJEB53466]|nr:unnamed protein product [Caenorhabditis sp. 36 PRJEB53466]